MTGKRKSAKLAGFDLLPGVWDESAEIHGMIWEQIRTALKTGRALNRSERLVLFELLTRLERHRNTRRVLGFKLQNTRTKDRNAAVADDYVTLIAAGKTKAQAEAALLRMHSGLGTSTLRKITDSGVTLGRARGRQLAQLTADQLAAGKPVRFRNADDLNKLLAGDPTKIRK